MTWLPGVFLFVVLRLTVTSAEKNSPAVNDIKLDGDCKDELAKLCKNDGSVTRFRCMQNAVRNARMRKEESPLSALCKKEFRQFFVDKMKSAARERGGSFLKECAHDLETLCKSAETNVQKVSCLRHQQAGSLQPSCKQRVFEIGESQASHVKFDPAIVKACEKELAPAGLCPQDSNSIIPGHGLACLRGHRGEITAECRRELFNRDMVDVADIRLNKDVLNSCRKELTNRCDDVEFGETRKLHCLWKESFVRSAIIGKEFSEICRVKVHNLTRHSLQDYRLDFQIRNLCTKDITKSCSMEKNRVDNLTLSELFGTTTQDGQTFDPQAGQVISCLKNQLRENNITSPRCRKEISRAVAVESASFGTDPSVLRRCRADMEKFCVGEPKNKVHMCLRKKASNLETQCKAKVETQAVLEGEDITRNIFLATACRSAINDFCKNVQAGDARVMHCLQDNRNQAAFPPQCKKGLIEYLESVNNDWRLKYGISTECKKDADRLCENDDWDGGGDSVLTCLKLNMPDVQGLGCKTELRRFVQQGVMNILLAPAAFQACKKDVKDFCDGVDPGEHRVHDCLWKRRTEISFECAKQEFEHLRITSLNAALDRRVQKQCGATIKKSCGTVAENALWECLGDHLTDVSMSTGCQALIESHIAIQHKNFDLNPKLVQFCKTDADLLCGKIDAWGQEDIYAEGEVISCLVASRDTIKDERCKKTIWKKAKEQTSNIAFAPAASEYCKTDIQSFCPDVKSSGRGEVYNCLEQNLHDLASECKFSVRENLSLRAEDIDFMPKLQSVCKEAVNKFCKETMSGFLSTSNGKVTCLLNHLHDGQMGPACADALIEEQNWRSKALDYNPGLKRHCNQDLEELLMGGKCPKNDAQDGWKLNCLRSRAKSLKSDGCKNGIRQYAIRLSKDIRTSAFIMVSCGTDLDRLCRDVDLGKARGVTCLKEHLGDIQDQKCKQFVETQAKLQATSASMNFAVSTSCSADQKLFCKDIPIGEGRLLACLGVHMTQLGFGDACKKALAKTDVTRMMKKYPKTTALSFADRYFSIIIAGVVGFVLSMGLVVSHHIITRKFLGNHYQVTPPVMIGKDCD